MALFNLKAYTTIRGWLLEINCWEPDSTGHSLPSVGVIRLFTRSSGMSCSLWVSTLLPVRLPPLIQSITPKHTIEQVPVKECQESSNSCESIPAVAHEKHVWKPCCTTESVEESLHMLSGCYYRLITWRVVWQPKLSVSMLWSPIGQSHRRANYLNITCPFFCNIMMLAIGSEDR